MTSFRTSIAFSVLLVSLSGCSFNPLKTDNHVTGNAGGAIIGGAAGASTAWLLGASKPWIVAAGLGGASIGYYVTTMQFASGALTKAGGQAYQVGDSVAMVIPTDAIFDTNSADLLPEATPILESAVAVAQRMPDNNILISGNSSGFGSRRYEQKLSEDRARQVAAFFWSHGISSFQNQSLQTRKLIYVGYDHYFPIANSIKADGIRQNSRIQITLYPSNTQLKLAKCYKVFNNMGDNSLYASSNNDAAQTSIDNAFPNDSLPNSNEVGRNDFSI